MPADVQAMMRDLEAGRTTIEELTGEQLERLTGKGWDEETRARLEAMSDEELERLASGKSYLRK